MKKIKFMIMAIGIITIIGCQENQNTPITNEETSVVSINKGRWSSDIALANGDTVRCFESSLQIFHQGDSISIRDKKIALLWSLAKEGYIVRAEKTKFGWSLVKDGDVVRVEKPKFGMIYVPKPTLKITKVGRNSAYIDDIKIKVNGKKVKFYFPNGKKATIKNKKTASLWRFAKVGQLVETSTDGLLVPEKPEIVSINKVDEYNVYVLSNSLEVWVMKDEYGTYTLMKNVKGKTIKKSDKSTIYYKWAKARVGQKVEPVAKKVFAPVEILDYDLERVVKEVFKYDGLSSKIDGSITGGGGWMGGSLGGDIHGSSMGSQNLFINVYFENGENISISAENNTLLADLQPGDTLVEMSRNGFLSYKIK